MKCGGLMLLDEIKSLFDQKREIKFKLYSLEYIIKEVNNKIEVYPLLYTNRKSYYSTLEDALNNYTVYNESIIDNLEKLKLIN